MTAKRFFFWALALGFVSTAASAFVPTPENVLTEWSKQTRKIKTMHVQLKTTLFDPSYPGGQAVIDEEIWIKRPSQFRRKLKYPAGEVNIVLEPSRAVRITGEKIESISPQEALGPVWVWFFSSDVRRLQTALMQAGVAEEGRWNLLGQQPVYEIGKIDGPRFWFSKLWKPAGGFWQGKVVKQIGPTKAEDLFPSAIELYLGDQMVERSVFVRADTDGALSDTLFDVRRLQGAASKK